MVQFAKLVAPYAGEIMEYIKIRILEWRDRPKDDARYAKLHPRVGTLGYQEIDPETRTVVALRDINGVPFPSNAVYGYEIVDPIPVLPVWGIP